MAYGLPGGSNTVIPLFELSGELMIAYGRKLDMAVNRYSKVTSVKSTVGNYLQFKPEDLARFTNLPQSPVWAPGTPRPTGWSNQQSFQVQPFRTTRFAPNPVILDKRSVDVASFPIMKTHTAKLGQDAMTHQAYRVCTALTTTGNYAASHVVAASDASLAGGFLDVGTTADPNILQAFNGATRIIMRDTMGAVRYGQISALMNHNTALRLSQSRELREYLMQQAGSLGNITQKDKGYNAIYGLPDTLYNVKIVVEDTWYVPYNRGSASEVPTVVFPDNTIVLFVADGDLEVPEGATSFATCHRFTYEEMTLETKDDSWNRLIEMSAVMDYDVQIVAPPTGFIITNCFS